MVASPRCKSPLRITWASATTAAGPLKLIPEPESSLSVLICTRCVRAAPCVCPQAITECVDCVTIHALFIRWESTGQKVFACVCVCAYVCMCAHSCWSRESFPLPPAVLSDLSRSEGIGRQKFDEDMTRLQRRHELQQLATKSKQ